jgi:hypothetical protein
MGAKQWLGGVMDSLQQYMQLFEEKVITEGFKQGIFGDRKEETVPLRSGRFSGSPIERFMGKEFEYGKLLAINYYGYFKLSSEVFRAVDSVKHIFSGIRSAKCPVVHFNSIKIDHIAKIDPDMLQQYDEFKKKIVSLRWQCGQK